ncbi:MAG: putative SOS response-associated peptidase YedK [Verrucomicrobiae bacterium]|nr:putative SOS response-associated peptidase YedK [Verrucomicrobiae bacterium]
MCGRFTLTADVREFADALAGEAVARSPRYNICPSQPVSVILNDGQLAITKLKWGLIPAWAKDPAIGNKLANARSETLAEKPSFRTPLKRKRCLVLADGFYEWSQTKPKVPHYFRLKSKTVFAFAGLWDVWRDPTGAPVATCCLITTTPNALLARIHHRMPVILQPRYYDLWLAEAEQSPADLLPALVPFPAEEMEGFPVAGIVNQPQNDRADCIQPVGPPLTP